MRVLARVLVFIGLVSIATALRGQEPSTLQRAEFTQLLMGVQAKVVVYAPSRESAESGARAVFDRIAALEEVMSDYRQESELSRLNQGAGGAAVRVSEDLWEALSAAKRIAAATDGAYDPTIGPLVRLWRESRTSGRLPSSEQVAEARSRSGWRLLELDEGSRTARLGRAGMMVDLGGVGKGLAAREGVVVLGRMGLPRCMVSLSGDIAVGWAPPGARGWRIAVEPGIGGVREVIEVENSCVSTSGDAEQFVEVDGVRYSHIVDPATGLGSTRRAAASVVAEDGATADALATALAVKGIMAGTRLLGAFPGVKVMMVEEGGGRWASHNFPLAEGELDPRNEPPAGFEALFNGRDLTGWQGLAGSPVELRQMTEAARQETQRRADEGMRKHWRVEDGVLVFDGKGDSLQSVREYRDFELYIDWAIDKGGDSGIYLRGTPQVQIWDNPIGSGGLYNNTRELSRPLTVADRPLGQWNRFHIIMRGERVTVYLNGALVVDRVKMENYWEPWKAVYAAGPVELQAHGNPLRFRNIFLREIKEEEPTDHDRRMAWWRGARFGMFIHWGLYAIPAGEWKGKVYGGASEWLMNSAKILPEEYEPLAGRFNPSKFDAGAWADLAREAGMRYIVITTKHHDGFCLFDSAHTAYDVMDATPFKRDVMKELSEAVRDKGLKMGWYHSILDWHHPDAKAERWERYAPVLRKQVEEILSKYGPIGVMWFDGEWEKEWTSEQGKAMYDLCRSLQPEIIINNRVGKGRQGMQGMTAAGDHPGDFGTPEQEVPSRGIPGVDWESCMTMNDSWGYHRADANWKSAGTLIRTLAETASKGGNFLLNVGPTELGEIPEASVERLKAVGAWMRVNSASIYETEAGPFARLPWGRSTMKRGPSGSIVYLHVFEWPASGVLNVPGVMNEVKRAYLLARPGEPLSWRRTGEGLRVDVPVGAPDANNSVVVLELIGEAAVVEIPPEQRGDGRIDLLAAEAEVDGGHARYESREDRRCIGFWTSEKDVVTWKVRVHRGGAFRVEVEFACEDAAAGSRVRIEVGEESLGMEVKGTGGWGSFETAALGSVEVKPGMATVRVVPEKLANNAVMNLRAVRLIPVADR
ncbi:MAG: alpha-L-fucosidase [Phycisphaeraceae bacterium]|nr:alpha-L-fucosidase [Phycisphaeraceae bacterium]